jgi:hypothetical protein
MRARYQAAARRLRNTAIDDLDAGERRKSLPPPEIEPRQGCVDGSLVTALTEIQNYVCYLNGLYGGRNMGTCSKNVRVIVHTGAL